MGLIKKHFFTLSMLVVSCTINATNYYVSNSGDDVNSGMSTSLPWATISKLNTVTFNSGDTIFFHSGDHFRGQLNIYQGGAPSNPVVITAYDSGARPIITGADTISSWSSNGTVNGLSIYQALCADIPLSFFVEGAEMTIARYPNEHNYLILDSAQNGYLKDASLAGIASNLISGAQVCVHSEQWCWELTSVASFSDPQLSFTTPTIRPPQNRYSYFLYNNTSHLDTENEWVYTGGSLQYIPPSGQNPNNFTCLASVDSGGIVIGGNASYVKIVNIDFEKQTYAGVLISSAFNTHITIEDCYFRHQFKYGVNDKGKYNEIFNSYFREIGGLAIYINGNAKGCTIHHNTFRNIGPFRNHGVGLEINLSAINIAFRDSCYIHHNDIDSTGYCGISADGRYNTIERNLIENAMLKNNDGAALKSFGAGSQYNVFKNNFVSSSDGNTEGTDNGNFITPAIYFDFSTNHCTIQENTIYNRTQKGIFQNSANNNNTIIGNVVYRANICLDLNGNPIVDSPAIIGMNIKHNEFFAADDNAYIIRQVDHTGDYNTGTIDSNYYFQPFNTTHYAYRPAESATDFSFAQWQATTFDTHTQSSFVSWIYPTRYDTLFMNPTDNIVSIDLGSMQYLDLNNTEVCGSITLQPYTSRILISTGNNCISTKIEDYEKTNITLSPNPAVNTLTIRNVQKGSKIQIIDIMGKCVINQSGNEKTIIDVKHLSTGMYFLIITNENKTIASSKFIKQ